LSSVVNNTLYSINPSAARCELIEGSSLLYPFEDRTTLWRHRGTQISMEQSNVWPDNEQYSDTSKSRSVSRFVAKMV